MSSSSFTAEVRLSSWEPSQGSRALPRWSASGQAGRLPTRLGGPSLLGLALLLLGFAPSSGCVGKVGSGTGFEEDGNNSPDQPNGFDPNNPDNVPVIDGDPTIDPETGKPRVYEPLTPVAASMMRLTQQQFVNTITDIFGAEVLTSKEIEVDETNELFLSIGAAKVGTSQRGVEQYEEAAFDIADKIMARRSAYPYLANCKPSSLSDPCIENFIKTVGRRLFRRPLAGEELGRYKAIVGADGAAADKIQTGLRFVLAGLLQSPNFLYIVNLGEDDPDSSAKRYTSLETASRLSYFIWQSTPDEELLKAGEAGDLLDPEKVRGQLDRMLGAARATDLATRFLGEAWLVSKLDVEDKNTDVFAAWNQKLVDNYKEEFGRVLRDYSADDPRDIREALTTRTSFLNADLAAFYGVAANGTGFAPTDLGQGRIGLFTSGAVIAANSPSDRSSPTHRGVFVVEKLLCREIPPPPDNVNADLGLGSSQNDGKTTREVLEQHRKDPACAGCHALFDPAGVTFENYDAIGAYRTMDRGQPVDARGALDGKNFDNVQQLAAYVSTNAEFGQCLTKQIYQYATAHAFSDGEKGVVDLAADRFAGSGFLWKDLVGEIVTSAGFRLMASQ